MKFLMIIIIFVFYRIIECSELTVKNSGCDPFATVTVNYSNGKQVLKRTKIKKKTISPYFNETFVFEVKLTNLHNIYLFYHHLIIFHCVPFE